MTNQERATLVQRLTMLAEYYDKPKSEAQLSIYLAGLDDLPIEQVLGALTLAVKQCRWFPTVAELREMVSGPAEDRAAYAWGLMLSELRRVGYLGQPDWQDPILDDTIRSLWGGWRRLCTTLPAEGPELIGWMKQFQAHYRSAIHRYETTPALNAAEAKSILAQVIAKVRPPALTEGQAADRPVTPSRKSEKVSGSRR